MSVDVEISKNQLCPNFQEAFKILGKKWNGLIIESLLLKGPLRFRELANEIDECSDRVLAERLKELDQEEIVTRKTFDDSALIIYELSDKGTELKPIMSGLHSWSDKWCCQTD
ncbi:transcriptional regulator [Lactobacillus sp. S2-2]|uniref:winged helix-turn-helix transcriptional regulator n=1 Tax=Lactobacillus sp. S2-2 TaxID=2692917 RepID=UPI001F3B2DDB|nr:helix-turn-helix domain-containing protein [Lactobacillus sp. S2-2]MCF6515133.1 transcriptional regulator [Lactobacillus sp. S2-2]